MSHHISLYLTISLQIYQNFSIYLHRYEISPNLTRSQHISLNLTVFQNLANFQQISSNLNKSHYFSPNLIKSTSWNLTKSHQISSNIIKSHNILSYLTLADQISPHCNNSPKCHCISLNLTNFTITKVSLKSH